MKIFFTKAIGGIAIAACLLGVALPATAAARTALATYNGASIYIDGQRLNGADPIVINGTTYLPLRTIGEAMEMQVDWNGKTNTVNLTSAGVAANTGISQNVNQVIYNENGLKITFTGITAPKAGDIFKEHKINLKLENTSTKDYLVQVRDFSVNGVMMSELFSCTVTAGKTAIDSIDVFDSALTEKGLTAINDAEFNFYIANNDNWLENYESDTITVK